MSFDLHIQHALHNGIKRYQGSQAEFRKIFYDVSQTLADKYFTKFQALEIKFDKAYAKKKETFPLIVTTIAESQRRDEQMLGNQGLGNLVLLLNHECRVTIYADDYDVVRILHRICQASMLLFKHSFLKTGYLDVQFLEAGDLEPEKDLTSDGVIVYKRILKYISTQTLDVSPISAEPFDLPWDINPTVI